MYKKRERRDKGLKKKKLTNFLMICIFKRLFSIFFNLDLYDNFKKWNNRDKMWNSKDKMIISFFNTIVSESVFMLDFE